MSDLAHHRLAYAALLVAFLGGLSTGAAQTEPRSAADPAPEAVAMPDEKSAPAPAASLVSRLTVAKAVEEPKRQMGNSTPPSHPAASQESSGFSVSGTVFDPSGAIVPGAKITLRGGNHWEQPTTTDPAGEFSFDGVPAGSYELQVQQTGFKLYKTRLKVGHRTRAPLRIVLAIAEVEETVTVESSEKVNVDIAGNVDSFKLDPQLLEALPLLDQDIVGALSHLVDRASIGSQGIVLMVDGLPSSGVEVPASAIQEVRINQNPYSAEFARPGQGRIEIITKSGSSKYHGSFNFRLRDYRLDARNAFAEERPQEQHRLFDGYFSGPVGKSKNTAFLISASRKEDDLQPVVFALGPLGPIRENAANPERSTYVSAQVGHQSGKNVLSFRYTFFDWSDNGGGVGVFNLPEVAWDSKSWYHQVYSSYKWVITPKLLNEFLIRIRTESSFTRSRRPGIPKIIVLDAFAGGGAQVDGRETSDRIGFTDLLSWARGRHFFKAGVNIPAFSRYSSNDGSNFDGTFYFSSLGDYAQGKPYSFIRQGGDGHLIFWQKELGLFAQDEVRVLPNLSIAFGLRYDWQNYLSAHNNFAPRLSFAFAPGKERKTVLRGGAGIFYDTTGPEAIGDTLRYDGLHLRRFVLSNPGFPDALSLGESFAALPSGIVRFAPNLASPYIFQYSLGMERQLRKSLTFTATYIGTRGIKLFRSRDMNAPPPPLYLVRPDPSIGILRQIESSGRLESYALKVTLKGDMSRFFQGIVMYTLQRVYNDTDGIGAFPANNYDLSGEWSRAGFDRRHSLYVYGTLNAGRFFKLGVVFSAKTGEPYSLTTGRDDNHDGFANDRPLGVRRNSLEGPGWVTLDLRWSKDFFFHPHKKDQGKGREKGRSATIAVDAFNVLNRVNFGTFVGDLSSPFFGRPVSAGPARRMQASLSFKF